HRHLLNLKERIRHIIEGSTYQGLEVFEQGQTVHYSFLKLKRSKGELTVLTDTNSGSLDTFIAEINTKNPLVLVINTSKVLKKQIAMEVQGSPQQWVARAFPNLDLDNFYWQT